MTQLGRPTFTLPDGLSAEEHEVLRFKMELSKRDYARKINVKQATYCRKTRHIKSPDGFQTRKSKTQSGHRKEFHERLMELALRSKNAERRIVEGEAELEQIRREIKLLLEKE